jgi:hypothetical protein
MCSQSYLKLGDLGVAKVLKHEQALASTQVGTPYYVAPEVWRNKAYNSKCDMWSLGCLLYELCTFRPPFEAESMEGLARKVMKGRYEQIPTFYSQALRTTLSKLLVVEPNYRSSVTEILNSEPVRARMGDLYAQVSSQNSHPAPDGIDIVKTIQVPRRFNDLTKNLPPSRYNVPMAVDPSAHPAQPPLGGAGANAPAAPHEPGPLTKAALMKNAANGHHVDVAQEPGPLTRHAGGGNTVAKAVESAARGGGAQYSRIVDRGGGGGGGGLKLPNIANGGAQANQPGRRPQPPTQPPAYPPHQRQRVNAVDDSQQLGGHGEHITHHMQPSHAHHGYGQSHSHAVGGGHHHHGGAAHGPGAGLRLPHVPGSKPPPTPSSIYSQQQYGAARGAQARYAEPTPSREIRMVYHKPNGDSRVSIFARGPAGQSRGVYCNPITHQAMESAAAGSRYHSRNQAMGMAYYPPRSLAQQYTAQRRRVTPSHWY